jgi:hypothetical protein
MTVMTIMVAATDTATDAKKDQAPPIAEGLGV